MKDLFERFESTKELERLFTEDESSRFKDGKVHHARILSVEKYDVATSLEGMSGVFHNDRTRIPHVWNTGYLINLLNDYTKDVFDYYEEIIEEIEGLNVDKILKVKRYEIIYVISGVKMTIDSISIYNYLNRLQTRDPDIIKDCLNETIKRNYEEKYLEDLIRVTVKVAKDKEANIIKDKLKKLIDEL